MKSTRKPEVLVVDDQPINVKLVQRRLEKENIIVREAYNGRECLNVVRESPPDVILLDVMMPEMDGIEVCRHLKEDPETQTIPIIFITARSSRRGKLEGLEAGAVDYINKPIDLEELIARVRTQLRIVEYHRQNLKLKEELGETRQQAAIGAVTEGIAHNLNNLLGVVVGYLDLIKNAGNNPDMIRRSIGPMEKSINRITGIVQKLSYMAKWEKLTLIPATLGQLIEESVESFHANHKVNPKLRIELHDPELKFNTNMRAMISSIQKLLVNAWESYPDETEDREIEILTEPSDKRPNSFAIKIKDRGTGFDEKQPIFEAFVNSRSTVGRGLGLTLARHSARTLGGDITLENRSGGGACATLTHPH